MTLQEILLKSSIERHKFFNTLVNNLQTQTHSNFWVDANIGRKNVLIKIMYYKQKVMTIGHRYKEDNMFFSSPFFETTSIKDYDDFYHNFNFLVEKIHSSEFLRQIT